MGVSAVGVALERLVVLSRSAKESRTFAALAGKLVDQRQLEELARLAGKYQASALARLFGAVASRYLSASEELDEGRLSPIDLARSESARCLRGIGEELARGVNVIATVGSMAPLVGVLGALVSLVGSLQALAAAPNGGALLLALSLALAQVALGFALAIPALVARSYFAARLRVIESALERSAGELLDELEARFYRESSSIRRAG
jgi:biopolymer transport protein ExbB